MQYICPLVVVTDLPRSREFYESVLEVRVKFDFGANITFEGDFSLQTIDSWAQFIEQDQGAIRLGARNGELYFETEDIEAFAQKLAQRADIRYVHGLKEHRWGQRVVRFYDPDGNIIEVGEDMCGLCRRFFAQGWSVEEICAHTMLPPDFVKNCRA